MLAEPLGSTVEIQLQEFVHACDIRIGQGEKSDVGGDAWEHG